MYTYWFIYRDSEHSSFLWIPESTLWNPAWMANKNNATVFISFNCAAKVLQYYLDKSPQSLCDLKKIRIIKNNI